MSDHRARLMKLLTTGGDAFRTSEVQRAHAFSELLLRHEPAFHAYLKQALDGHKPEAILAGDEDVKIGGSYKLGMTVRHTVQTGGARYVGRAFALRVEGKDLSGNISLEQEDGEEVAWRVATNETWPTMVIPFTRRGKFLGARLHLAELEKALREAEREVAPGVLAAVFAPIDTRLQRIRRAIRGR